MTLRERWARRRHARRLARTAGPRLLRTFADTHPAATFIEIGANDGRTFDHLHGLVSAHGWRGVMVEPVPYVFARLRETYADADGIALVNAAVADREATLPFYHLREASPAERAGLPDFYDALGSFSEATVLAHEPQIPDIRDRLVRTTVPTTTFARLLADHGFDAVDLVAIDTEGHDAEIIRSIDLERHGPRLLVYEHFHLSPAERRDCLERGRAAGYEALEEGFDTFWLRTAGAPGALARCWRRLEPALPALTKADEVTS